jgi:hypothetical protein
LTPHRNRLVSGRLGLDCEKLGIYCPIEPERGAVAIPPSSLPSFIAADSLPTPVSSVNSLSELPFAKLFGAV